MGTGQALPRDGATQLIVMSTPSFGMVSLQWAFALCNTHYPACSSVARYYPKRRGRAWLPVDDARNLTVKFAQEIGAKYIFFRDDDVIDMSGEGLLRLFAHNVDIVAGVYCMKRFPTEPLIYKDVNDGPYKDWKHGDVLNVGGVGMGFALIKTSVFDKLPEPWFRTTHGKDDKDPTCKGVSTFTEDLYFCRKAKQHGFDIWVDTSVQCHHYDHKSGRAYVFRENKYGYVDNEDNFFWLPTANDYKEAEKRKEMLPTPSERLVFEIGNSVRKPGVITVDFFGDADVNMDFTNIQNLVEKYGEPDEIIAQNAIERVPYKDALKTVRNWVNYLKPGGTFKLRIPDIEWAMKSWLETPDTDPDKFSGKMSHVYGSQHKVGEGFLAGYNKAWLEGVAAQMPFSKWAVAVEEGSGKIPQALLLIGEKKSTQILHIEPGVPANGEGEQEKNEEAVSELIAAGG